MWERRLRRDLAIETTIATLFDAPTKAKNAAATLPQNKKRGD